jgi:acyl-CoA reductase-like NAD-dependent aldehyde dehydrogenase
MTSIESTIDQAVACAADFASSPASNRARLLEGLAIALDAEKRGLVQIAAQETSLGESRLLAEVDRTVFQLRGFAAAVLAGAPYATTDDAAVPGPPPAGRAHLRRVRVPLGPVAMFSASNFPFAFSVLGGDTASALAAGCPVVVKGHPAHPHLSAEVHALARSVIAGERLPAGLIGHVAEDSYAAGLALVRHPGIQAVAFTGSLAGAEALIAEMRQRDRPIPFYGELGSLNPVVVLPAALREQSARLAKGLAESVTQGAGQFCTSPGLVVLVDSLEARVFARELATQVDRIGLHPMLSSRIRDGFLAGVGRLRRHADVEVLSMAAGAETPSGFVGLTSAGAFLREEALRHEVFGAACLCVVAQSAQQVCEVLASLGGSLTASLWGAEEPSDVNRQILRAAQAVAGRVLFSGVPTGVAVAAAQHHGGPWPASTQPLFTSVGYAAIDRFLRPLALQDAPPWVLERTGVPI